MQLFRTKSVEQTIAETGKEGMVMPAASSSAT